MKKKIFLLLIGALLLVSCGENKSSSDQDAIASYISNSKKAAFVDTIENYSDAVMIAVNRGVKFRLYSTDTLFLLPAGNDSKYSCIQLETGGKSEYSDTWNYLYIGVIYDGKGYNYYSIAEDGAYYGIPFIDRKTLVNDGMDYVYEKTKATEEGNSLLRQQYNKTLDNIKYEKDSRDYSKLINIMPLKNNEKINKIVIIGSKDCSYIERY